MALVHAEPLLEPLDVEVGGEGDAVVLVVDPQDLADTYGCTQKKIRDVRFFCLVIVYLLVIFRNNGK